jgi:hypothetical protein
MSDIIGIRYIVVAVGGPKDPATEEDVEVCKKMMEDKLPFTVTVLSERVSNRLTWALIDEGAMSS